MGLISTTFASTFPIVITLMYTIWFLLIATRSPYAWKFGWVVQGFWLIKLLFLGPDHYITVCLVNITICYIGHRNWLKTGGYLKEKM